MNTKIRYRILRILWDNTFFPYLNGKNTWKFWAKSIITQKIKIGKLQLSEKLVPLGTLASPNRGHLKPCKPHTNIVLRDLRNSNWDHIMPRGRSISETGISWIFHIFFIYTSPDKKRLQQPDVQLSERLVSRHHYRFNWGHLETVEPHSNIEQRGFRGSKFGPHDAEKQKHLGKRDKRNFSLSTRQLW